MVKEKDVFDKVWDFADEKLRLQFSIYYKKGSKWVLVSKDGRWNTKLQYRWSCNLKRKNKSYAWKDVLVRFQSYPGKIQLYSNSKYDTKVKELHKFFKLIDDSKLHWCGYGYFKMNKTLKNDKTFLGGFITGDPVIPTPSIAWAITKKRPARP